MEKVDDDTRPMRSHSVSGGGEGKCPSDMVKIPSVDVCIDRYEASIVRRGGKPYAVNREGMMPADKVSFNLAMDSCKNAGKRLCRLKEWDMACMGKEGRKFPYGNKYDSEACNCADIYLDPLNSHTLPSGKMRRCKTPEGVYDMSGNVWEWVDESDMSGTLRLLRGGGFSNTEHLLDCQTTDESFQPMDVHIKGYGFRCCKDIKKK